MQSNNYTIRDNATIVEALKKLNDIPNLLTIFAIDKNNRVIGTLTDGDIRRGLIKGLREHNELSEFINRDYNFLVEGDNNYDKLKKINTKEIHAIPLLTKDKKLIKIYDLSEIKTILPLDAVIMAGGKGLRLKPFTNKTPKPLLKVGEKEIVSYNFDRLYRYGISKQYVIVNYLGNQVEEFCKNYNHEINFEIIYETKYFGTAGSLTLIDNFSHDLVLLVNSDLLTNIDYEDFYISFLEKHADMMVASVPYNVKLPYAIFETNERFVKSLKEKPLYTHYANAGIYLFKKEIIDLIPKNRKFNATDLMMKVIKKKLQLIHYPIRSYWLDIGKHDDLEKAQKDIKHIDFD